MANAREQNTALEDICRQLLDEWELTPDEITNLAANVPGECKAMAENRAEEAWVARQESMMASGGPDNSAYRREMVAAGRSRLLK
jgi:hypothetical protein